VLWASRALQPGSFEVEEACRQRNVDGDDEVCDGDEDGNQSSRRGVMEENRQETSPRWVQFSGPNLSTNDTIFLAAMTANSCLDG
jgi:hypothetical protein